MAGDEWASYLIEIHQLLLSLFDEEELKTLCLSIGVNYQDLPALGRANKARKLVLLLGQQNRLDDLQRAVIQERPQAVWPKKPEAPADRPDLVLGSPPAAAHERLLRVFLCHGTEDKPAVRDLYRQLSDDGLNAWLDEEDILPGQDWDHEIRKAVRDADVVLVCLSSRSVRRPGYLHKEIRLILDVADEQPEGEIFTIPVNLDDCQMPERLRKWQWVSLSWPWAELSKEPGYKSLVKALNSRAESLGLPLLYQDEKHLSGKAKALQAYHESLIESLSSPRYRLDSRFVQLTLLLDQGPEAQGLRFAPDSQRSKYQSLNALLDDIDDRAVVLLGKPGSGKTTLLRRLQLERAWTETARPGERAVFFLPLNAYRGPAPGAPAPPPYDWLAQAWATHNPNLPPFHSFFEKGQLLLLLDGLNEMPHRDKEDYRERIAAWQTFWQAHAHYGNTVVFSCRSLQYSAPLSSELEPVPQVQVEPLSPEQIEEFLNVYLTPEQGQAIWVTLSHDPEQLKLFSTPFFLRLLVDQAGESGRVPAGQSALLTGFVRQTLIREIVHRHHPLFAPGELLSEDDVRQVIQKAWGQDYGLPEEGPLLTGLVELAYAMQDERRAGEAGQVRIPEPLAEELMAHPQARAILEAGIQLNVLDKDLATREITFYHQLLQEYFAARRLAREADTTKLAVSWRAEEMAPPLAELLASLGASDPLSPAPSTGWEETAVLAAAMSENQEKFVTGLAAVNLPLAARCLVSPEVSAPAELADEIRQALLARISSEEADLRARIATALALGELGDPRFVRKSGPFGHYLLPPLVPIPGGTYTIGDDESQFDDEKPAHPVTVEAFEMGLFPVTNAEYDLFFQAGGYEEWRWWETDESRAWLKGEGDTEGQKEYYRELVRQLGQMEEEAIRSLPNFTPEQIELFLWLKNAESEEMESQLEEWYPGGVQYRRPEYWRDSRFNGAAQPVVGLSWFEARAYCAWLSAQTGEAYTLPNEAEWEAAARGKGGRSYAYGHRYDAARCNTFESHIRGTTPVGVYPGGYTLEGLADLSGNVWEWTGSAYQPYPYDAADGREDPEKAGARVVRGGSWISLQHHARAASRLNFHPSNRYFGIGFRVVRRPPSS